jgi:hypothetical protein
MMNIVESVDSFLSIVMLNIYVLLTTDGERRETEYAYFYDAIVASDLSERQKLLSHEGGEWSVKWSRENDCFEYVGENGVTVGFDIDSQPPTVEELDNKCLSSQQRDTVVVEGFAVSHAEASSLEASAPTLEAILL